MHQIRGKNYSLGFSFTSLIKGKKSTLYEVKSIMSGTIFYHVVLNSNKNYPNSEWPETIFDKNEAIKKLV